MLNKRFPSSRRQSLPKYSSSRMDRRLREHFPMIIQMNITYLTIFNFGVNEQRHQIHNN